MTTRPTPELVVQGAVVAGTVAVALELGEKMVAVMQAGAVMPSVVVVSCLLRRSCCKSQGTSIDFCCYQCL